MIPERKKRIYKLILVIKKFLDTYKKKFVFFIVSSEKEECIGLFITCVSENSTRKCAPIFRSFPIIIYI